jgi:predicted transcriptional regulator
MGKYKAWSTMDVVKLTGRERCSVLKRLHKLKNAGFIEKKETMDGKFFWIVVKYPEKPPAKKIKKYI